MTAPRWLGRTMLAVFVDAVAWAAVQAGTGYAVHRLPDRLLERDTWLLQERRWERGGRFYVDVMGIRRWKGRLPEGGGAFRGGFDKRHLRGRSPDALAQHTRESRRAELGHWLAMVPTPWFVRRNPWVLRPLMVVYALAVNLPCIAAQRYNRIRLRRAHERSSSSRPAPE